MKSLQLLTPLTKELKKHSSRLVGRTETGNWGGKDAIIGQGGGWWTREGEAAGRR